MIKKYLTLFGILFAVYIYSFQIPQNMYENDKFNYWVKEFNIELSKDSHNIYNNWILNDKFINRINSYNFTYKLGHNAYSGYSYSKYVDLISLNSLKEQNIQYHKNDIYILPSIDWRLNNAVSSVKNQGNCGSCWAFSTIGALEGAYSIKYGIFKNFSVQQLVDCDNITYNNGCYGGYTDYAFYWINYNKGLCYEESYPYVSETTTKANKCLNKCKIDPKSKIVSYFYVQPLSDNAMMAALSQQPVAVTIDASSNLFRFYKNGVFTDTCGTKLNHAVLLVGYYNDYYILKNSWGTKWGEDGYMRIGKGINPMTNQSYNNGMGQCGVLLNGMYPKLI